MAATLAVPRVLIGPRSLDDRICRLMYVRETDRVWAEEWNERAWVRANILVRYLLKAPSATVATLEHQGIPDEPGEWELDFIRTSEARFMRSSVAGRDPRLTTGD